MDWANSTAPELRSALQGPCVGLWAVGSTEQHGPHLVTGFDHLAAAIVVERAAADLGADAIVLPTLALGCSAHWLGFGATLSLGTETMIQIICDVARSASQAGLRQLVVVNGHAGNIGAGMAAVGTLGNETCRVHFVSYWDLIGEDGRSILRADAGIGHAGELETAIGLAARGLVRGNEIPSGGDPYTVPLGRTGPYRAVRVDPQGSNGVVGDPSPATAEAGQRLLDMATSQLAQYCRSLLD